MAEELRLYAFNTAEVIRRMMLRKPVSPWDVYRMIKELRKTVPHEKIPRRRASYQSVRRYFYILSQIGLIEKVFSVPGANPLGIEKNYYRIKPGMENDPRWRNPQKELYYTVKWGGKRYRKAKKQRKVKYGRKPKYRKT